MTISFEKEYWWSPDRYAMAFTADVDGRPVMCLISGEALRNRFSAGQHEMELEYAFLRHRPEIEAITRELIESGRTDPSGKVLSQELAWDRISRESWLK